MRQITSGHPIVANEVSVYTAANVRGSPAPGAHPNLTQEFNAVPRNDGAHVGNLMTSGGIDSAAAFRMTSVNRPGNDTWNFIVMGNFESYFFTRLENLVIMTLTDALNA